MKYLFILFLFFSNAILANYSKHPEAKDVIRILVSEHGFDESYVIKILETANTDNFAFHYAETRVFSPHKR